MSGMTPEQMFLHFENYSLKKLKKILTPIHLQYKAPWGTTLLHLAAMRDKADEGPEILKYLIKLGGASLNLNIRNNYGTSPYWAAKFLGCESQAAYLYQQGADPEFKLAPPPLRTTPLKTLRTPPLPTIPEDFSEEFSNKSTAFKQYLKKNPSPTSIAQSSPSSVTAC